MSIFGGLTGSSSRQAANTVSAAAGNASGATQQATKNAQDATNNALNTNAANVNAAVASGQAGVNQAVGSANSLYQGYLQNASQTLFPYLNTGNTGANLFNSYIQSNPQFNPASVSNFLNTPAMQFQIEQGSNAINNTAAASGVADSGATAAALQQYGQGVASQYYQQAFNDALQQFQTNDASTRANLGLAMGVGQNAAGQYNQAMNLFGSPQAQNTMAAGYYNSNLGYQGATFNAGQNLSGQEFAGEIGLQGTKTAMDYLMSGANAQAAGDIAEGNVFSNDLSLAASLAATGYGISSGTLFNGYSGGGGVGTGLPRSRPAR